MHDEEFQMNAITEQVNSGRKPTPDTMITPDKALQLVLQHARRGPSRTIPVTDACGLQLAEPVTADRDYPPFPRAMMDGFAVHSEDAGGDVAVLGEIPAGRFVDEAFSTGQCFEIMTGAPCPPGTDAVVPKEHVRRRDGRVQLPKRIASGQHIAARGSECRQGEQILRPDTTITPLAVAVMASFGKTSVRVTPKPTVGIISTGAELVPAEEQPQPGEIRDSNGPMLLALVRDAGIEHPKHLHADDRLDAILAALTELADRDVILVTGGVSVGGYDLVPQALDAFGVDVVFHRVKQKPGKPLLFGKTKSQLFFGLPGNPLAGHFCFHRYVRPAMRKASGKNPAREVFEGELVQAARPKSWRTYFAASRAERDGLSNTWKIRVMPGITSADIFGACQANCYAQLPPGQKEIPPGETVGFSWIGDPYGPLDC